MTFGPPHPAIGTVNIELYGPGLNHARWDIALWGTAVWAEMNWQDVTPQSMNAQASWGADDGAQGVLAMAAAGTWNVRTYDPDRKLDPSNPQSQFQSVLKPGSRVRVRYNGTQTRTVASGIIDTITYSVDDETGSIRATDGISRLVAAKIPALTPMEPTTLRAMARRLLIVAGIPDIAVEADPVEGDPTVGAALVDAVSIWEYLSIIALDVLHAIWLDRNDVIRFRSFGEPRDMGLAIAGVDGIPLDGLSPVSSLSGVFSQVAGFDVAAPTVRIMQTDATTKQWAGEVLYERTRPVPNAALWIANVLTDRAGAGLQFGLGRIRPRNETELLALLDTEMVDIAHLSATHRDSGRELLSVAIEAAPRVLGGQIEANTRTGWSVGLVAYVTVAEWADAVIAPEPPPAPPPATQTVTRTYVVNKDTRAVRSSSGTYLGSGTEGELPVGLHAGYLNRAFLGFASIPWGDVISVVSAELRVYTTTQVNVAFGSSPRIRIQRVTKSWSEGSAATPSGSNATIYPGPTRTSTGEYTPTVSTSQGVLQTFDITRLVKAWAPASAGGSAAPNHGLALVSYTEGSVSDTTEFWAREHGAATDAEIRITVKIPA